MKLECMLNHLQCELFPPIKEWWFEVGLTYQTTEHYHRDYVQYRRVLIISLLFFSIYIRW